MESKIVRDVCWIVALVLILAVGWGEYNPAEAKIHPGGVARVSATCAIPTDGFDGCDTAHADAQFMDPNILSYAKNSDGSDKTLFHTPDSTFNAAGKIFPVGRFGVWKIDANLQDPVGTSIVGVGNVIGGNTLVITSITTGTGVYPQPGWYFWDTSTLNLYPQKVKIASAGCTGSLPAITCPLDQTVTNHNNINIAVSLWAACTMTPATTSTIGLQTSINVERCTFNNSTNGWTTTLDHPNFGPVNGHNGSQLTFSSGAAGTVTGKIILNTPLIKADLYNTATQGGTPIYVVNQTSASNDGVSIEVNDADIDGGNVGTPLNGPYNVDNAAGGIKWISKGTAAQHTTFVINRAYIHDWTTNALNISQGYTDYFEQSVVYFRTSLHCTGLTPSLCHGAPAQFGTSIYHAAGILQFQNRTVVYPYGSTLANQGVTAPLVGLAGTGAAIAETFIVHDSLIICNAFTTVPPRANCSTVVDPFRVGSVPIYSIKNVFVNESGIGSCQGIGADLQPGTPGTGYTASAQDLGNGYSLWSTQGWQSNNSIYFPGQGILQGTSSNQVIRFRATLAPNADPTKTNVTITQTVQGNASNLTQSGTIQPQIVGLRVLGNWQTFPLRILSGSGTSYVADDGSGHGLTDATGQMYYVTPVVMPFGFGIDPNTGLPPTASDGSMANANGTILLGGSYSAATTNNWIATAIRPGNFATLDADNGNNWSMGVSGSSGLWTVDGPSVGDGNCPGHISASIKPVAPVNVAFIPVNDNEHLAIRRRYG